jgi:hypothetical protein
MSIFDEEFAMRYTISVLALCLLAGCSGSPPKPLAPHGDYRPVNRTKEPLQESSPAPSVQGFDFQFEGDIVAALEALRAYAPQLLVSPPQGKVMPLRVQIDLHGATLADVLRAIGEQGGTQADLVLQNTRSKGVDQVFIRFRAPSKPAGAAAKSAVSI